MKKYRLDHFLIVLMALGFFCGSAKAVTGPETVAKEAVLLDVSTGTILYEKNADERTVPSSMAKMMTLYLVFENLKSGKILMDDTFLVSEKAWRTEGSKTYVEVGKRVRVEDLIKGSIIQSGNDATVVLAEGIAGSEEGFVEEMNAKAQELGLKNSHFSNATGWPDENTYSTVRDLAILGQHLIKDFPQYYTFYSQKEFTYHGIKQGNRNPLLYRNMGADGIKTGHTEIAGYGLAGSVIRGGRRLLAVLNGLPDMQSRADESVKLMEWGYSVFQPYRFAKAGVPVTSVPVKYGQVDTVSLVTTIDAARSLTKQEAKDATAKAVFNAPVRAPIKKGTVLGQLVVTIPGQPLVEFSLVAAEDIKGIGFFGRIWANIHSLWS